MVFGKNEVDNVSKPYGKSKSTAEFCLDLFYYNNLNKHIH